jgi:uncharacterized membrane protein
MIIFYLLAGINHFLHPQSYYAFVPLNLAFHRLINRLSGAREIIFGFMLIFTSTRRQGALGIIASLVLSIPAHIYMIQKGGCRSE